MPISHSVPEISFFKESRNFSYSNYALVIRSLIADSHRVDYYSDLSVEYRLIQSATRTLLEFEIQYFGNQSRYRLETKWFFFEGNPSFTCKIQSLRKKFLTRFSNQFSVTHSFVYTFRILLGIIFFLALYIIRILLLLYLGRFLISFFFKYFFIRYISYYRIYLMIVCWVFSIERM